MSHGYLPANMADGDLARTLWKLRVPLLVTHAAQPAGTPPFVATVPRFSYLAQLLPRLRAYYGPGPELACSSFHHEEVQLRNLPVGLLADLYQPVLPWRLVVGSGEEWHVGDTFLNGAKEVCILSRLIECGRVAAC